MLPAERLFAALGSCAISQPTVLQRADGLVAISAADMRVGLNVGPAVTPQGFVPTLDVMSNRPGFAYVFLIDAASNRGRLVYPDSVHSKNWLDTGELHLPRGGWRAAPKGEPVSDHVLVTVAAKPQDRVQLANDVAQRGVFVVHGDFAAALTATEPRNLLPRQIQ